MLSTSPSFLSFFSILCALVQAESHGKAHWYRHSGRPASVQARSSNSKIGIVYDGTSELNAFSGEIGFSVDWSPLPLSSSDNLDLGTFIPQLWTFQDSNRKSPYHQTLTNVSKNANRAPSRTDLNPWTQAAPSWPTGVSLIGFNEPDQ